MSLIITAIARKGGSGKSSTALNLCGAHLDADGGEVLLIDLDPQATLSKSLLGPEVVRQLRPHQTVQAVAERTKAAGDIVMQTGIPGLLLLPSSPDLQVPADAVLNLAGIDAPLVVIDTPPDTRDHATRCALLSSNAAISPTVPEPWGIQSVGEVQTLLMGAGIISNEHLIFTGFLISMMQRAGIHAVCESTLRRLHGSQVYDAVVQHAVVFKEATAAGQPVTHYAPKSGGAKVARQVYQETCERIETALKRGAA